MKNSSVIKTFLDLVQINSPTGHEREISLGVVGLLKNLGLKPKLDGNNNVIVQMRGRKGVKPILLNAHLDTVEPGRHIKPVVGEDDWIHSDGKTILGADNKAGVAVILETVRRLIQNRVKPIHPLEIVFTTSEESGNLGAVNLDYSELKSRVGYAFDIAGGNVGDILVSSPFYNRIDICLTGKTVHAKEPEKGRNVLPSFARAINQITLGRVSENTLVNIGIVSSGSAVNSVPGNLIASGEVRSTVEKELKNVTNSIRKVFERECSIGKIKLDFKETLENPGFKIDSKDKFLTETVDTLRSLGVRPALINSFGCSDANIFAGHGIEVLNIASGERGAHSLTESVRASDLEKLVEIVTSLVQN